MGKIIFAYDQNSGGVHIDPVDDPRTHNTVNTGKLILAMGHQSIDQGSRVMSGCRMHNHSLRLIDQDHILVLIKNV